MALTMQEEDMGDTFYMESIDDNNVVTFDSNTWLGSIGTRKANVYLKRGRNKMVLSDVVSITLNAGDRLYFINEGTYITKSNSSNLAPLFTTDGRFNLGGDLCKFMWGTYNTYRNYGCFRLFLNAKVVDASKLKIGVSHIFSSINTVVGIGQYVFSGLFLNCRLLETPPQLTDSSTVQLGQSCYAEMFMKCISLTTAPELPATKLANHCYSFMFTTCTSLTTAPELPATTLKQYCYARMFEGCTSLSKSPILKATKYVASAYSYIFNNCTNISTITCLLENIDGLNTDTYWVQGVADSGVFYKSPNVTMEEIQSTGTLIVPSGWEIKDYEG